MTSLVLEQVPDELYAQIQILAERSQCSPEKTALAVLEHALQTHQVAAPWPDELFLTDEISAPIEIPWPVGTPAVAVRIDPPPPEPHDFEESSFAERA